MAMIVAVEPDLPVEEDDVSATEPHNELVDRIKFGLRHRLANTLVLGDIFVREGRKQASPDVFTVPGATRGARRVYRLEDEPLPEVTIEVISEVNKHDRDAIAQLHRKRRLLGEIGIVEHIELDPIDGVIIVYHADNGVLDVNAVGQEYVSERLAGTRFVVDAATAEGIRVFGADGVEFEEPAAAMARADQAQARADAAQARADAAQARADQAQARVRELEHLLALHGVELPQPGAGAGATSDDDPRA